MKTHKKINLEKLPRKNNHIDWVSSVGEMIEAEYGEEKFLIEILDYKSEEKKLVIKIGERDAFEINTSSLKKMHLGKYLGAFAGDFRFNIGDRVNYVRQGIKRSLIIIDREILVRKKQDEKRYIKRYKYKCQHCPNEDFIEETNLKNDGGCNVCGATNPKTLLGYNTIYDLCEYTTKAIGAELAKTITKSSGLRIKPICPACGIQKDKEISIYSIFYTKSIGCIHCSDGISTPNKFAYHLFKSLLDWELIAEYENEHSPLWANGKKYDNYFRIESKKYILEMDGGLGHGTKVHSRSTKTVEDTQMIDDEKDRMAKENGIEIIRIDCRYKNDETKYEFMKVNLLSSKLNEIVDLNVIDWIDVTKKSQGSLVIKACELKKEQPEITTTQIAKIMNMNLNTIRNYLKRGAQFGWCDYDAKKESQKASKKAGEKAKIRDSKEVEIYSSSGELLGIYPSLSELERASENDFGVKLLKSKISPIVGTDKAYKGFKFKYTKQTGLKELSPDAVIAYQMKNENPKMTTKEIGIAMGKHFTTVISYLKDATERGLCNYNPKEETQKRVQKMIANKNDSKKVGVYKDGKLLREFDSLHDLERQSCELFNERFSLSQISRVCNNKTNEYKGYTIKFI